MRSLTRQVLGEDEVLGVDLAVVGERPAQPAAYDEQAEDAAVDERHARRRVWRARFTRSRLRRSLR